MNDRESNPKGINKKTMITTPIQIRFNDIDLQGHMYNGQYMHIFDLGKNEYFQKILGIIDLKSEKALITAKTTTNFLAPVGLNDKIAVRTGICKIGNKSFEVSQQMINTETDQVVADCRTVMVAYNTTTRQSFEIPAEWREKIEKEGIIRE